MPCISACCDSASATTSGESNRSGPERIEGGIERHGRDLLPHAVLEADHERLLDVELDLVARAVGAVDGESPIVVRENGEQLAAVGPVRLETGSAEKLDDLAPPAVLAAHDLVPGHPPD